jgi:hypothetical protein
MAQSVRIEPDCLSQLCENMPGRDGEQDDLHIDHKSAEVVALRISAIGRLGRFTGIHTSQVDVVPMKISQVVMVQNQFVRHHSLLSRPMC